MNDQLSNCSDLDASRGREDAAGTIDRRIKHKSRTTEPKRKGRCAPGVRKKATLVKGPKSMASTYRSADEAAADKEMQLRLVRALGAARNALRLDECRAWTIFGSKGHVYTRGKSGGWLLFVSCRSVRHWTMTRRRLEALGCIVTQDGDDEGCVRLLNLPRTPAQAAVVREALGLSKSRSTPAHRGRHLKRETAQQNETLEAVS